jgi:hypothetical protein
MILFPSQLCNTFLKTSNNRLFAFLNHPVSFFLQKFFWVSTPARLFFNYNSAGFQSPPVWSNSFLPPCGRFLCGIGSDPSEKFQSLTGSRL